MATEPTLPAGRAEAVVLAKAVQPFIAPNVRSSVAQIANTILPYVALWAVMIWMLSNGLPYWSVLPIIPLAAAFQVRIFILFHDCCHGSFFASRRANTILGYVTGILTFTPFNQWRRSHATHHDTVGDLDRRGTGDIWTMTTDEFEAAPGWKRLAYRVIRNPVFLLTCGTFVMFVVAYRFSGKDDRSPERRSVIITNVALAVVVVGAALTIGLPTYLMIQIPIILLAGAAGLWLFYVQHQFEGTYWARHKEWDPVRAALEGSSYYKLPRVLQWFTGNIGFHHIHHVQQRIPNYNLERCFNAVPRLRQVRPLTLRDSMRAARLHLWDESRRILRGYRVPAA